MMNDVNDVLMATGMAQMTRDRLRKEQPPFAPDCDHAVIALPVIDFLLDYACTKCGGFRSFSAGLASGMDPGRLWPHDAAGQLALLTQREVSQRA
jgi:hypothetical protein